MNPFQQLAQRKPAKNAAASKHSVTTSGITICDDAYPDRRPAPESKYAPLFRQMKPGQCLKCDSQETSAVANSMRKWLKDSKLSDKFEPKLVSKFPADGKGRVWLMLKQSAQLKSA